MYDIWEKEKQEFEKATKCHICEDGLETDSRIDHLGKIQQWLKDMRLHNSYPSESEVKDRIYNPNFKIEQRKFDDAKQNLLKYLKENKNVIVRDHCHWTGNSEGQIINNAT